MTKKEINKLDKIAREIVREQEKCIICGKLNIQIHHIEGRRIRATRWYLPNLVPLCPLHHTFGLFSAHQSPTRFGLYLVGLKGKEWEKDLIKQSMKTFKGTYQDVENYLFGKKSNYC